MAALLSPNEGRGTQGDACSRKRVIKALFLVPRTCSCDLSQHDLIDTILQNSTNISESPMTI